MGGRFGELLLILIIILVLFGAGRVPRIMNDIAKGIKAFKDGFKDEDKGGDKGNQ
jgi:sec-independent protein translocase protein TatA